MRSVTLYKTPCILSRFQPRQFKTGNTWTRYCVARFLARRSACLSLIFCEFLVGASNNGRTAHTCTPLAMGLLQSSSLKHAPMQCRCLGITSYALGSHRRCDDLSRPRKYVGTHIRTACLLMGVFRTSTPLHALSLPLLTEKNSLTSPWYKPPSP